MDEKSELKNVLGFDSALQSFLADNYSVHAFLIFTEY